MRLLLIVFFSFTILFACDGDCMKCHQSLLKNGKLDSDHVILAKCIYCHKITSNDLEKMGSLCGQDCWDCHDVKKTMQIKIKEHLVLEKCIACHSKLERNSILKFNTLKKGFLSE